MSLFLLVLYFLNSGDEYAYNMWITLLLFEKNGSPLGSFILKPSNKSSIHVISVEANAKTAPYSSNLLVTALT